MQHKSIRNHPQRRGFTLIELLVVVSVIAILAGLLIPSIQMARRSAQKAKCLSNLRQLGMMVMTYADHHHSRVPFTYEHNIKQSSYWFVNHQGVWHDAGMIYNAGLIDNPQAFYCPLNTRDKHQFNSPRNVWPPVGGGVPTRLGYAFRPLVNIDAKGVLAGPLPILDNLTNQVIAADICDRGEKVLIQGHGDGISGLWADGHVSLINYKAFQAELDAIPLTSQDSKNNAKIDALWAAFDSTL